MHNSGLVCLKWSTRLGGPLVCDSRYLVEDSEIEDEDVIIQVRV